MDCDQRIDRLLRRVRDIGHALRRIGAELDALLADSDWRDRYGERIHELAGQQQILIAHYHELMELIDALHAEQLEPDPELERLLADYWTARSDRGGG